MEEQELLQWSPQTAPAPGTVTAVTQKSRNLTNKQNCDVYQAWATLQESQVFIPTVGFPFVHKTYS